MLYEDETQPAGAFLTTRWSIILKLNEGREDDRREALELLCQQYWYPLYVFIRRKGKTHEDAQDLAQGFFERMLARDSFKVADEDRGRFRNFLLKSLERYIQNQWRHDQAQRRGGGISVIHLDAEGAFKRFTYEPESADLPADKAYDKMWAETVIARVMDRLKREFIAAQKLDQFEAFKPFLVDDKGTVSYSEVATNLGMGVNTVRTAIHRFRHRYARCFRDEIAETVEKEEDVESEIIELLAALSD
ncbi:MAG: sigma-70 family RNA polymerase sigma factor [Verrucomicrobiales bacterium]|nr:sigma-70 family RNA polymerase sigma factor [Verrucomicrobiales bacterium]